MKYELPGSIPVIAVSRLSPQIWCGRFVVIGHAKQTGDDFAFLGLAGTVIVGENPGFYSICL